MAYAAAADLLAAVLLRQAAAGAPPLPPLPPLPASTACSQGAPASQLPSPTLHLARSHHAKQA